MLSLAGTYDFAKLREQQVGGRYRLSVVVLEKLQKRIEECGLREEDYAWYCDLRRYGSCVHSGFGLGVERLLRYITGMENIRDVIAYPRTPGSIIF